jgi:hypothetical protein|tara:strand:- start:694 stop:1413 length:720 start_codon:yes stop_codon:yes gene_type:complete
MKHKDAQAFVRKYNTELAIRGYSKMKKADLFSLIDAKLKHNRIELQQEWKALKAGPERPMAVKQGPRAGGPMPPKKKQMGVKTPKQRPMAVKQGPRAGSAGMAKRTGGAPGGRRFVYPKSGNKPKGMTITQWRTDPKNKSRTREVYSGASGVNPGRVGGDGKTSTKTKSRTTKKAVPRAFSRKSQNAADDAWHARNKDTSGQAQVNRLNAVTDRLTRREAIQRDKERTRRIRGRKVHYI